MLPIRLKRKNQQSTKTSNLQRSSTVLWNHKKKRKHKKITEKFSPFDLVLKCEKTRREWFATRLKPFCKSSKKIVSEIQSKYAEKKMIYTELQLFCECCKVVLRVLKSKSNKRDALTKLNQKQRTQMNILEKNVKFSWNLGPGFPKPIFIFPL